MKMQGQAGGGPANHRPVEIHIDALVLHGFHPGECYRIAAAMQRELARLIGREGAPASAARTSPVDSLDVGAITIRPGSTALTTGAKIAVAVYRGLRQQGGHAANERAAQPTPGGHPR